MKEHDVVIITEGIEVNNQFIDSGSKGVIVFMTGYEYDSCLVEVLDGDETVGVFDIRKEILRVVTGGNH